MLSSISIDPDLWPTSAVLDWVDILQRVDGIAGAAERRAEAAQIVRSRLNFQGTVMSFSTERNDALWWLMIDGDVNAVRGVLTFLDDGAWREDLPRMLRGALARQQRGHWSTTVANAWGVLAMRKFSDAFESTPVTGSTQVGYGGESRDVQWSATRWRRRGRLPVGRRAGHAHRRTRRQRPAMGDSREPCGAAAGAALVHGLHDRAQHHAGRCRRRPAAGPAATSRA